MTGTELGQFLHQRVLSYDLGQTPQYGKIRDPALDQGDFVFPLKAAASAPMVANVPKGPGKSGFDLGAIQRAAAGEKASRRAWAAKLREMRGAYRQVAAIDKDKLSPGLKASAWGQFLAAFTGNNPYTNEDEELRAKANMRLAWWRGEKRRLARMDAGRKKAASAKRPSPRAAAIRRDTSSRTWRDPVTEMEFVEVPGGSFEMGCLNDDTECGDNEKPVRFVRLDGFWMGKFEVTQGQWKKIMGNNPSKYKKSAYNPVDSVSWNNVKEFINRLNRQSKIKFSLPSEAQWEYACRAGGKHVIYGTRTGHVEKNSTRTWIKFDFTKTPAAMGSVAVGTYPPNAIGLHNMTGNVRELVQDKFTHYSEVGSHNPIYEGSGMFRILRGGNWGGNMRDSRCSFRLYLLPSLRRPTIGFRLVRVR